MRDEGPDIVITPSEDAIPLDILRSKDQTGQDDVLHAAIDQIRAQTPELITDGESEDPIDNVFRQNARSRERDEDIESEQPEPYSTHRHSIGTASEKL